MKNKLDSVFSSGKKNILNVYFTAGFPALDSTVPVLLALQKHGADIIEIGIPFSDPLADGPVIQQSSMKALQNGMNISTLFSQLLSVKEQITVPVVLMGYFNPVYQFGFENFCKSAKACGVSGLIIPDLPLREYEQHYMHILNKYHLHFILLITPETGRKRLKEADRLGSGFLYAVSSSSTTGSSSAVINTDYLKTLQRSKFKNPVLLGFGISNRESFQTACTYVNGAIIGSAYIKKLSSDNDIDSATRSFLSSIIN